MFLTFITRACRRPVMLATCIRSVIAQTDHDWEQVFIVDKEQRGLVWANNSMAHNAHRVRGQWVFHLDDDCKLIEPMFVERVTAHLIEYPQSEVVMVKTRRPQLATKILPHPDVWGRKKGLSRKANGMCHVVRADVWRSCIPALGGGGGGAGRFIARLINTGAELSWLDMIGGETQQLGRGRKFEDCKPDWFEQTMSHFGAREDQEQGWTLKPYRLEP